MHSLRKCSVFSHVCLSVCLSAHTWVTTHGDARSPSIRNYTIIPHGHMGNYMPTYGPVQICSLGTTPFIGKRTVSLRLKGIPVFSTIKYLECFTCHHYTKCGRNEEQADKHVDINSFNV